ncbi:hypothetical protein YC2023_114420 [Brassica napus]
MKEKKNIDRRILMWRFNIFFTIFLLLNSSSSCFWRPSISSFFSYCIFIGMKKKKKKSNEKIF